MPFTSPLVYDKTDTSDGYLSSDALLAAIKASAVTNATQIQRIDTEGNKLYIYFSWLMPDEDKLIIDGLIVNHEGMHVDVVVPSPVIIGASAHVGVEPIGASIDHQHGIAAGTAVSIGTTNTEGVAASVARSDHTHNHGQQTDGYHHAIATTSTHGFLSAPDKTKLDSALNSLQQITATNTISTSSGSLILATGMTVTPAAGTYLVLFSGSVQTPNTAIANVSIYSNGSEITAARRTMQGDAGLTSATPVFPFFTIGTATVNGAQTIEGRWSVSALGSAEMYQRSLVLIKLN